MAITFYHCPFSRSTITLNMLEELGVPYELKITDVRAGAGQTPEYLAINPMAKVPAIVDDGQVVTETPAICLYLAEKYPAAGLAPPVGDPTRPLFLRWLFLTPIIDAVLVERLLGREPAPAENVGYGDYSRLMRTLKQMMAEGGGPWMLGDRFSAVDVTFGASVPWAFQNKTLPEEPPFVAYAEQIKARPAYQRAQAKEAELFNALKQP